MSEPTTNDHDDFAAAWIAAAERGPTVSLPLPAVAAQFQHLVVDALTSPDDLTTALEYALAWLGDHALDAEGVADYGEQVLQAFAAYLGDADALRTALAQATTAFLGRNGAGLSPDSDAV